jgi:hypothetical protein
VLFWALRAPRSLEGDRLPAEAPALSSPDLQEMADRIDALTDKVQALRRFL